MARLRKPLAAIWYDMSRDLPGYNVAAVEAWIGDHVEGFAPPFSWLQLVGGHSNLTYKLTDRAGRKCVVRRPPEGELLPKAHDMSREWAVISALDKTDVPAPVPLAFCESPDVTGAWFYLMSWVDGVAIHTRADAERLLPEAGRRRSAESLIDALAALHMLDPDKIGLGGLAKKTGYITRQIRAWYRSWTASAELAGHDDPRAHRVKAYLEANLPNESQARIVHGDCGLHNVLVGADHNVSAILDWEITTLGDPLADIAYVLNTFADTDDRVPMPESATASAPGFPSRSDLAVRYMAATGADLWGLDYYYIFNHWKTAAIIQGVCARYSAGSKSAEGVDIEGLMSRVERALTLADYMVAE